MPFLLVTAAFAAGTGVANAAGPVTARVSLSSWSGGQTALYTVANGTSATVPTWTAEFGLAAATTAGSRWDALITTWGSHAVAKNRE